MGPADAQEKVGEDAIKKGRIKCVCERIRVCVFYEAHPLCEV